MGLAGRGFRRSLVVALTLLPALAGCSGYHPQTTLHPTSDFGTAIDVLFRSILIWEIGIFLVVEAALLIALFRFRRSRPEGHPPQLHGHTGIEVAWTLAPALILVFIGVPTVYTIFRSQAPAPASSLKIEVTGHQWWWEFRYPELGVITANEIRLPRGRPVHLEMTSADVIHSFWLPRLGGKRDVIPGRKTHLWFTPDSAGTFPGQCAEFCGTSHANMRLRGVVLEAADFDAWAAAQRDTAPPPTDSLAIEGLALFRTPTNLCTTCHTIQGISVGVVGPNLTHVGSRGIIAGGLLENTPQNVTRWVRNAPSIKPGAIMPAMPQITEEQARAIAAYLESRK